MEKLTNTEFIERSKNVHNNKYDYSKTNYINKRSKVIIICPEHGEFEQKAEAHINGAGCYYCGVKKASSKKAMSSNDFIQRAKEIHGDKYDYSLVDYKNNNTKVNIICPEHGSFWQIPSDHLYGRGCPSCSNVKKLNSKSFIEKAKQIHGNKYDYSLVDYVNSKTKVNIICLEHGKFEQSPGGHLQGYGCPCCSENKPLTTENIKKNLSQLETDYDYSKVSYTNSTNKIKIICPIHGEFEQRYHDHLKGHGCPYCVNKTSKAEKLIVEILKENDITLLTNDRSLIKPYELDIIVSDYKLAIEFNGLFYHSEYYKTNKNYHKMKTDMVEQQGYQLIHIFEDEWLEKPELIKRMLIHKLGLDDNRVYARQCSIKEVSKQDKKAFYNQNHIQGNCNSSIDLGLYCEDELVACLSFKKLDQNNNWDLVRYATSMNVIGGFSKLLKAFQNQYDWESIITFADRRYSQGDLYYKNGFEFEYELKPDYYYVNQQNRFHKFGFRHKYLQQKLDHYDSNLTEHQNCYNNGYYRIYDAGKLKFKLTNN